MSNRISWRKFDKIRISETLENHSANSTLNQTPTRKRKNPSPNENKPLSSKRKHGSPSILSKTTEEELLSEAQSWGDDKIVNWSNLARQYGITKANGG